MKLVNTTSGADYALTKREQFSDRLPKRYSSELALTIDGSPTKVPVTKNAGWSGDETLALTYPWILVGNVAYYVTLGPGETLEGEFSVQDGKAARSNPKRETVKIETEASRIAKFKVTYAVRQAAE
jgi:hypothetical protein